MLTSSLRWCGTDEDDKETLFQLICGPTFRSSVVSFSRVVTKKLNTLETYFRHCTAPSKYPFSCNATHPLVDAEGLHTLPEKAQAIVEALALQNVGKLKSLLGLLSYNSRFLPNMATMLARCISY